MSGKSRKVKNRRSQLHQRKERGKSRTAVTPTVTTNHNNKKSRQWHLKQRSLTIRKRSSQAFLSIDDDDGDKKDFQEQSSQQPRDESVADIVDSRADEAVRGLDRFDLSNSGCDILTTHDESSASRPTKNICIPASNTSRNAEREDEAAERKGVPALPVGPSFDSQATVSNSRAFFESYMGDEAEMDHSRHGKVDSKINVGDVVTGSFNDVNSLRATSDIASNDMRKIETTHACAGGPTFSDSMMPVVMAGEMARKLMLNDVNVVERSESAMGHTIGEGCSEEAQAELSMTCGAEDNCEHEPVDQDDKDTTCVQTVIMQGRSSDLGDALIKKKLLSRAAAEGRQDGNWVYDTTIMAILAFLQESTAPTFKQEPFTVGIIHVDSATGCVLNSSDASGQLTSNHALLIVHIDLESETGYHYSSIILNAFEKKVHVFDTLGCWHDDRAWALVRGAFPLINFRRRRYSMRNHTGKLRQRGATCGAWSTWIIVAYALNYKACRLARDEVDTKKMEADAVAFWKCVTY